MLVQTKQLESQVCGAKHFLYGSKICVKMLKVVKLRIIEFFLSCFVHFPKYIHELVLVICCCITSYPKLNGLKHTISSIWGRPSWWRQLVSVNMCMRWGSWKGGGRSMAASWNHLKACSPKRLVVNAGCWQGPRPGLSARTPTHDLSFWLLGFLTAWWLGSRRAKRSHMAYLTQFWKSCSVSMLSPIG